MRMYLWTRCFHFEHGRAEMREWIEQGVSRNGNNIKSQCFWQVLKLGMALSLKIWDLFWDFLLEDLRFHRKWDLWFEIWPYDLSLYLKRFMIWVRDLIWGLPITDVSLLLLADAQTSEVTAVGTHRPSRRRPYRRLPVWFQWSSLPRRPWTLRQGNSTYLVSGSFSLC